MSSLVLTSEPLDSIGFSRLHALVARGYKPLLGTSRRDDGHVGIPLVHPRAKRKNPAPTLVLWSDGIVSTRDILWPNKYVPNGEGPPDWQRYILPEQQDRFESFALSIDLPDVLDLYLKPFWASARLFAGRLIFGATLCTVIGTATWLLACRL